MLKYETMFQIFNLQRCFFFNHNFCLLASTLFDEPKVLRLKVVTIIFLERNTHFDVSSSVDSIFFE